MNNKMHPLTKEVLEKSYSYLSFNSGGHYVGFEIGFQRIINALIINWIEKARNELSEDYFAQQKIDWVNKVLGLSLPSPQESLEDELAERLKSIHFDFAAIASGNCLDQVRYSQNQIIAKTALEFLREKNLLKEDK